MTEVRCHSCSMFLTRTESPLTLVAIFKASAAGRLVSSRADEVRRRCRHCGWVNVFHPATPEVALQNTNEGTDKARTVTAVGVSPGHLTANHLTLGDQQTRRSFHARAGSRI